MKTTILAVFCLTASLVWADDEGSIDDESISEVDLRVSVIEHIVVTSEKSPDPNAEALDDELEAILDEADALETDEESQ